MLVTRIVGVINILDGIVVQSLGFNRYLPIGSPEVAVSYLNQWGIDEIVILDINGSVIGECNLYQKLAGYTGRCQTPVSAGGGIKTISDIESLISNGADKVVINTKAHEDPNIIRLGAQKFGEQAIVVSIDVRKVDDEYKVFVQSGNRMVNRSLIEVLKEAQAYGAGEIFVNSIDRDGSKKGYDLELFHYIVNHVSIPIVGCGGVGLASHFLDALPLRLSGLAAGNFFHYTEHSVILLKSYLRKKSQNIRLDTHTSYHSQEFLTDQRLGVLLDCELENLKFKYIPEEKI